MRIFVIGSSDSLEAPERANFRKACESLGKAIANRRHNLIICSGDERTADPHLVRGANSVVSQTKVLLYRPDRRTIEDSPDNPPDPYIDGSEYSNLTFFRHQCTGGWRVVHLKALHACDAVLAIGGNQRGTGTVVSSAEVLEKPVIIIPTFGGAAEEVWGDFYRYYSDSEQGRLLEPWANANDTVWAERIINTALSIVKRNPFKRVRRRDIACCAVFGLSALEAWITFFFCEQIALNGWLKVILLLSCASLIGIFLRRSLEMLGILLTRGRLKILLVEVTAGLLITFALLLLAQFTNFALNNETIGFENLGDVQRVGGVLSLLSLITSLSMERAWHRISNKWPQLFPEA